MNVLNNVGSAFEPLVNLYEPTGSWVKDIRNRAIFGAVISTAVCVTCIAKDFFREGVNECVASIPVTIGACVGIAALFPICGLFVVAIKKTVQSSQGQLIGNQLRAAFDFRVF